MEKFNNNIPQRGVAEKLNIDDIEPIKVNVPEIITNKEDPIQDVISDYEYIRKQSIKSIASCDTILTHVLGSLTCEMSPRHIEGCSAIIDTQIKCSKGLIEIHEKLKKLRQKPETTNTVNDNDEATLVGSVKDVLKIVNKQMKEEE